MACRLLRCTNRRGHARARCLARLIRRADTPEGPNAGFRGETSEDGDPDDAPRKVELTVTDDAMLLPLSITVPVFFMPLVIRFQELCTSASPCSK